MKKLVSIALGAVVVALVLATAAPVQAACSNGYSLPTPGYISNPGGGSYVASPVPNFTPNAKVTFWSLTSGDAALLAGDDSGSYTVYLRNSTGGPAYLPYDYSTGTAMVTDGPGPFFNYSMTFATNWGAASSIDGCIDSIPATSDRCTCVLVQDQWAGNAYMGILSAQSNTVGDFSWSGANMGDLPKVRINNAVRNGVTIDVGANLENITAGLNNGPGCDCSPVGYNIYSRTVTSDAGSTNAPVDRNVDSGGWVLEVQGAVGGADVGLPIDCGSPSTDVYLGASLTWPGGFETDIVSSNTTKIACDPNLADPADDLDMNRPKVRPTRPLRPTRSPRTR